ncbi:hypothetical protein SASPL_119690 [Salvia splendens]|uniref:Shikimate O-hydroxycinnamoyltransferase n=1 Tax=Salvia splendens TaxID=180675 RepID=A0A8X8ZUL0_SALSN|nr:vinorine synthase-like [Salvia splendens]KAG6417508.1 hypothetical protein SASPL_119690 [Salvia splendens]
MEIETKVISIETIKPSSPTPKSMQKHQLSFIDQIFAPVLMPLLYFYSSNSKFPRFQISNHLKKSLSITLSIYYPLAGRLVGNLHVDCNDAGVPFAEAEANCTISRAVTNPDPKNTYKFAISPKTLGLCMAVQVTYFRCGGVAVGISFSHKLGDALCAFMVAKTWSTTAGDSQPKFNAAAYFPPRDNIHAVPEPSMREDLVAGIFSFPESEIAGLRERCSSVGGERRPSRVEALTAFIWTRLMGVRSEPGKKCALLHLVNLRAQVDPPMSKHNFGNVIWQSRANPGAGDDGERRVCGWVEGW